MSHDHVDPVMDYVKTFVFLVVMFLATVAAWWFIDSDIPGVNIGIAMLIATIKAVAVITVFMGMRKVTKLTQVWAYAGLIFFLTLIVLALSDYFAR